MCVCVCVCVCVPVQVGSPPCPVIACTSYVSVEDQEKFKAAGFSGLLGKPFQLRDLQAALRAASVPLSLSQEADRPFFVRV
ncbi:MAG: hypothetical protein P4L40_13230 [Terracidiphilus sp.]|nr:hypothetical protein [Terracidiphilus sp.]